MLVVTYDDVGKLHKALTELDSTGMHAGKAFPIAVKESINASAFATRRHWEKVGRKYMKVRNKWTFKGQFHQVKKARLRRSVQQMEATAGNKHPYMAMQEKGFRKSRTEGLQIPTTKSRIGASSRRIVSRAYWRSKIGQNIGPRYDVSHNKFARTRRGGKSRQQRYVAGTVRAAKARGKRFVYLEFSETNRGIYDVGARGGSKKLIKVWNMNRKTTSSRSRPMLETTLREMKPQFLRIHRSALENQIRFVLKKRGFRVRGPDLMAEIARFKGY